MTRRTTVVKSADTEDMIDIDDTSAVEEVETDGVEFFAGGNSAVDFIPSGCTLLDLALGGGWGGGRVINIVGDKSSGKTLLCIEACANFVRKYRDKPYAIWYNEAEAAFDEQYAETLGLPTQDIFFIGSPKEPKATQVESASNTVEGLTNNISKVIEYHRANHIDNGLYIIDSIDALSDDAELGREIGAGSYGANKAKKLGEMFRRMVRDMKGINLTFIMVSQVRDNIGVTFGETKTRSGGRALDFYSSQIVWLAEVGKDKQTISGIERTVGVNIRARVKKNKIGLPFREADYLLQFSYGIDDLQSNLDFLLKVKDTDWLESEVQITKTTAKRRIAQARKLPDDEYNALCEKVVNRVKAKWRQIEKGFLPVRKKYT